MSALVLVGFGAAALGHAAVAAYLWGAMRRAGVALAAARLLPAAAVATAGWAGAEIAFALRPGEAWAAASAGLDLLRYALWFALLLALGAKGAAAPRRTALVFAVLVVLAGALHAWQLLSGGAGSPPGRALLIASLVLAVGGLYLLERLFRSLAEESRWGAKPLLLALGIVFSFDVYMTSEALMFGGWSPETAAARGFVHALAVPVLLLVTRRRGDWMARLRVSRVAAFHSVTLALTGGFLLLLSAAGYYVRLFGGSWGHALSVALAFAAAAFVVTLGVSGELRSKLRVFVSKHFFSYRFDYREQWLRFTAALTPRGSAAEVGQQVVKALADLVECPGGHLWTRARADGPFVQAARWNAPAITDAESAEGSFVAWLQRTGWVVDLEEFRSAPRRYEGFPIPAWLLASREAWLVVPLLAGTQLQGFVVLAQPRARIDTDWEVRDLLKTASRQAAGYLAQMQATEALLEARKFDAFNRMSAFVVHDLKNIVTQLSLMLKNAERLHDNREFQQDMLLTVESSLEKMRRLMLQLREGEAPAGASHGIELAPLFRRLAALAEAQGRRLETAVPDALATRGHDQRLERVLGHLVQNALDATQADGRVWLKAERQVGQVRIEVGDTGSGMSEEFLRTRLFTPFSSTKASGMGVGAYESAQYVRELGGSIEASSRPGAGTVVTVRLPLFDNR